MMDLPIETYWIDGVQVPSSTDSRGVPLGEVRFFFGAGLPFPILYLVLFAEHETFFGLGL